MTNFFFYWYIYLVGLYNLNIKNDKGVVGMDKTYKLYNAVCNELHFNIHYLDETVPPLETFDGNTFCKLWFCYGYDRFGNW